MFTRNLLRKVTKEARYTFNYLLGSYKLGCYNNLLVRF
jgi:hypothetical protein